MAAGEHFGSDRPTLERAEGDDVYQRAGEPGILASMELNRSRGHLIAWAARLGQEGCRDAETRSPSMEVALGARSAESSASGSQLLPSILRVSQHRQPEVH